MSVRAVFQLVEGIISLKRPPKPLGYFSAEDDYPAGTTTFDFGAVRKDIHIQCNKTITVRLNNVSSDMVILGDGVWTFDSEWADKAIITFTELTHLAIYANG